MTKEEAERFLDRHLEELAEHFEAVQILVTDSDKDGTLYIARGKGNFYARKGLAQQFIDNDHHNDAAQSIKHAIKPDDDNGQT